MIELLKAFLTGICASAPLGPAALFVVQNTLNYGHKTGFSTGLGVAVLDTMNAAICFFAVSLVQDFIFAEQKWILAVGGVLVAFIGLKTALKKSGNLLEGSNETHCVSNFFKAIGIAAANPGALILMFGIVALLKIDVAGVEVPVIFMVMAVYAGAALYWFTFSFIANLFRKSIQVNHLKWINYGFGFAVMVFGVILTVKGLLMF